MAPLLTKPGSGTRSLVGAMIGERYKVERLLDEGAMGRVFVGQHVHMRKRVAIKILRPELTKVPEVMARFEREAMAAAHIAHPNVATATDFGKLDDGSVYLVLEFVEGRNLRSEIKKGPIPYQRALLIARQISEALTAAHALEIVHRDLKPENVMLVNRDDAQDVVKVLDFGVAKVPVDIAETRPLEPGEGALVTKAGMVFGTPDYMAPEQALGQAVDGRADLYSLGVILYEMLAGVRPFRNDHDFGILGQQLSGGIEAIATRSPGIDVPAPVEELVRDLLRNESGKRVQSAQLLTERIDELLLGESVPGAARGSSPDAPRSSRARLPSFASTEPAPPAASRRESTPDVPLSTRLTTLVRAPFGKMPDWEIVGVGLALVLLLVAAVGLYRSIADEAAVDEASVPTASTATAEPSSEVPADAPPAVAEASEPQQPPQPTTLTDEHVEEALKAGALAVDALVKRFPDDGRAHLAAARFAGQNKKWSDVATSAATALRRSPELATDEHLAELLRRAVQNSNAKDATLELLQGPMKASGADILYDLAVSKSGRRDVADAATRWLDTKGFERASSAQASIAAALFRAKTCKIRKALVKRAEHVGDLRAAEQLESFAKGEGCSAKEAKPCNACLAKSKEIEKAIAAIKRRQAAEKKPQRK